MQCMNTNIQRCISLVFYIKPQLFDFSGVSDEVVYLQFSTSNHNRLNAVQSLLMLYIFSFLHQTTTLRQQEPVYMQLYIFSFLHQTTTPVHHDAQRYQLYIFSFLHQTTTEKQQSGRMRELYIFSFLHQTTTSLQAA